MEIDKLEYYISQRLEDLTDLEICNEKSENETFPYLVYKLSSCNYNTRHRKDWILEIDYWNDSNDDSDILEAAIDVKNGRTVDEVDYIGLNNSTQDETEGFYQCHIDWEGRIPEVEPNMSRYGQRYILKVD